MDTEILVDDRIEDGQRLVSQLVRDGFAVVAAFWIKPSEEELWQLYIASPSVNGARFTVRTNPCQPGVVSQAATGGSRPEMIIPTMSPTAGT